MDQDRKFLDTFLIVIGALMLFTVAMYFLANHLAESNLDTDNSENPYAMAKAAQQLEPVGKVLTTEDELPAAQPVKVAASSNGAAAEALSGEAAYNKACIACHGAGVAGAPKFGDAAAWTDRIAQGNDTLYKHAIEGYQGSAGYMPPKGGASYLSDEEVKAAVDYMVEGSK
ncbi:MAG: c-type cytochrome [Gammaproteobacteria bacterium]|nr:c-type cytochrome [Gammaproteobacteria bacterium]